MARAIRSPSTTARDKGKQRDRRVERQEQEREERRRRLRLKVAAYDREAVPEEMPPVETTGRLEAANRLQQEI